MGTMALGGIFLHTPNPPSVGSSVELLFDIAIGAEVRARAQVRNCMPGKGMGVKFVNMRAEDRSRLHNFLKLQIEAGNVQEEFAAAPAPGSPTPEKRQTTARESVGSESTRPADHVAQQGAPVSAPTPADAASATATSGTPGAQEPVNRNEGGVATPPQTVEFATEKELKQYVALCAKSNYYQLLGITAEADKAAVKKAFYILARKFHPDRHMGKADWVAPLQQLMGAVTEAYNVLSDDKKREAYDKKLTLSRNRTETEESIDDCLKFAAGCQRDNNLEGAIVWLRKCVKLAPDVAKHRVSLGACLSSLSHHRREAIEHFEKAIELDPWNTGAYLQFGELYEAMQLPWRAEPLYAKILEYDPVHKLARQRLARVSSKEKKKGAGKLVGIFTKK